MYFLFFQIPTKLKEALRIAKECIEKRLIEEQKQVHVTSSLMAFDLLVSPSFAAVFPVTYLWLVVHSINVSCILALNQAACSMLWGSQLLHSPTLKVPSLWGETSTSINTWSSFMIGAGRVEVGAHVVLALKVLGATLVFHRGAKGRKEQGERRKVFSFWQTLLRHPDPGLEATGWGRTKFSSKVTWFGKTC